MTTASYVLLAIAAFIGGLTAIMAMLTAFAWSMRSHGKMFSLHFGGMEDSRPYREIDLVASDVREGHVYVRYRNTGNAEISGLHLKVKVFDGSDLLIADLDEFVHDYTKPGSENENLLGSDELLNALDSPDKSVKVSLMYAQTD